MWRGRGMKPYNPASRRRLALAAHLRFTAQEEEI